MAATDEASGVAKPRILVVDDEAAMRLLCRANLEAAGFEVVEASDGLEALAAVRTLQPDLILLDVMMPGLDGFAVAEALSRDPATRAIPVVFVSALVDFVDQARGFELGGIEYVTKPFNPLELEGFVQQALLEVGTTAQQERRLARLAELQARIALDPIGNTQSAESTKPAGEPLQ